MILGFSLLKTSKLFFSELPLCLTWKVESENGMLYHDLTIFSDCQFYTGILETANNTKLWIMFIFPLLSNLFSALADGRALKTYEFLTLGGACYVTWHNTQHILI